MNPAQPQRGKRVRQEAPGSTTSFQPLMAVAFGAQGESSPASTQTTENMPSAPIYSTPFNAPEIANGNPYQNTSLPFTGFNSLMERFWWEPGVEDCANDVVSGNRDIFQ